MDLAEHSARPSGCAHTHGRALAAADIMVKAEQRCRQAGVRLTPIRRNVLETLLATHKPLGAYDIAELIGQASSRRLAPITIYRALDFLQENGFVHRLETRNAFVPCLHAHGANDLVVFMICEDCGGIDEADGGSVTAALDHVVSGAGFVPRKRVIEITGVCEHCCTS